jgi:hypothetical protein
MIDGCRPTQCSTPPAESKLRGTPYHSTPRGCTILHRVLTAPLLGSQGRSCHGSWRLTEWPSGRTKKPRVRARHEEGAVRVLDDRALAAVHGLWQLQRVHRRGERLAAVVAACLNSLNKQGCQDLVQACLEVLRRRATSRLRGPARKASAKAARGRVRRIQSSEQNRVFARRLAEYDDGTCCVPPGPKPPGLARERALMRTEPLRSSTAWSSFVYLSPAWRGHT